MLKSLIYKYFTDKSLFLKDLAAIGAKSLTLKDRTQGGSKISAICVSNRTAELIPISSPDICVAIPL